MTDKTQAELLAEFRLAAEDVLRIWCVDIFDSDDNPMRVTYHDDGTVTVDRHLPIGITETVRLRFAVGVVPVVEESHGFFTPKTWKEVRVGDWVRPQDKGEQYRVTDALPFGGGKTLIEIDVNGRPLRKPRPSNGRVWVRTKTREKSTQEDAESAAIALLAEAFPGSEILS